MIHEIAQITIDPARATAFEAAVAQARPLFERAHGCRGMRLERQIEDAGCYYLRVAWETLEDHIVRFRESADFQSWRGLAGPFFLVPPVVVHSSEVGRSR